MSGKNLYNRNDKIQMLRDQFMLSKKLYYSYLLNYTDEYWRNIYLKFKEKIRKTSLLIMTINNVFYKARIKTNRTTSIDRTNRINRTTRTSHTNSSSDTISLIDTEYPLEINKGNKCIPYDNLMNLVIKMKAKGSIKHIDKKFVTIIINRLQKLASKSKNKKIKNKLKQLVERKELKVNKKKTKTKTKTKQIDKKTKRAQLPSTKQC